MPVTMAVWGGGRRGGGGRVRGVAIEPAWLISYMYTDGTAHLLLLGSKI